MKYRNIFWGIILIFMGILGLLDNFNLIYFSWHKLWNLWPVFLILWGISILPVKDILKVSLVIITLAFTIFYISNEAVEKEVTYNNNWTADDDDEDSDDTFYDDTLTHKSVSSVEDNNETFLIPYPENIKHVNLILDAVAGHFILRNSTTNLATFNINDKYLANKYTYYLKTEGSNAKVSIKMKKHSNVNLDMKDHNAEAVLKLNTKPVWNFEINAGAADLDLDLTKYKVEKLNIDAGAASIDVKLGDRQKSVNVDIDAGAAEITIRIPENAACVVDIDTFLSDKTLNGFVKRNGKYYTENFDDSETKFNITIDSAISDLNIIRY